MQRKLLVFDCDGVLTIEKSSWGILHEYFKSRDNRYFADLYSRGLISYLDWMKIDIALMIHSHGKPIKRSEVEEILSKIQIRPSAKRLIVEITKKGHIPVVVSSGVDIAVKRVCRELGIEYCFYNELIFEGDELIPGGIVHVPLGDKVRLIKYISSRLGIGIENTIYIGDSEWDIEVFRVVPVSIAVEPCGEACIHATYIVKDLEEILELGIL